MICSSPSQPHSGPGGGFFPAPLSLPHQSILSSAAQPPGWAPWTHPPGPQEVWQKYPQLLQRAYETAVLHLPLCSPRDAVVIATKTDDFCSRHLLYIVKVVCEEAARVRGRRLEPGKSEGCSGCWEASLSQQTCNIRQFGRVLAGHVIVVEVHHDDPFFFFLQRWTEEETLDDSNGTRICHCCSVRQENR